MKLITQSLKRANDSVRYSIWLLDDGKFKVNKWGIGAFPLDEFIISRNQAFELKHMKDSRVPYFVCNKIITYRD